MTPDEKDGLQELAVDSDEALFEGTLSDETPVVEEVAEPADGQDRNADGTFKAKEDKPEVIEQKPVETRVDDDQHGQVPSWRVREINAEKAEALKRAEAAEAERVRHANENAELRRQLEASKKPAETKQEDVPDPLLDPKGYTEWQRQQWRDDLRNERGQMSMEMAREADPETFDKAYQAVTQAINSGDRLTQARIYNARNPGRELIAWHKEQEVRREVGNDPAAYKSRVLEEALKDPAYLAKAIEAAKVAAGAPSKGVSPVRLPPSLATAARADAAATSDDNDVSDEALFKYANG
jgi:hypothetical protein